MNSHMSTRKSGFNACSRHASRTPDFASSRESSTPAYLFHTSPAPAARSSMWIQRSTFFLALLSACRPTPRSTTLAVVANLVRNYSPFLAPTTRSAPPTAELRRVLGVAARDMLEEFLRKWRRVRSDFSTSRKKGAADWLFPEFTAYPKRHGSPFHLLVFSSSHSRPQLDSIPPLSYSHFPGRGPPRKPLNRGRHPAIGPTAEESRG